MQGIKAYAAKRRWEHQHKQGKAEPMDIGEVGEPNHNHSFNQTTGNGNMIKVWMDDGYGEFYEEEIPIDAIGKGKAK